MKLLEVVISLRTTMTVVGQDFDLVAVAVTCDQAPHLRPA